MRTPDREDLTHAWVRLPNGKVTNIFEAMKSEKTRGEQVLNTSLLKPGDIVALQYAKDNRTPAGMLFKVDETELQSAGINVGASRQLIGGRFHGEGLEPEVTTEHFHFAGSGWGGNFAQFGLLVSGRTTKFYSEGGRYLSPVIEKFGVYRPDGAGEIRPVSIEALSKEAKKVSLVHDARVARVKILMDRFQFAANLEDCSQSRDTLDYEDDRYLANYEGGRALGNRVVIFDKQTSRWMEYGYFDFQGEGSLKASFADLSGLDFNKVFISGYILGDSSILHADVPVTTFNTSSNLGMNVINYRPGDKDLGEIGIPDYDSSLYRFRGKPSPNIQCYPDGRVQLESRSFFVPIETSHPGALRLIREAVTVSRLPNGEYTHSFNGKSINAIDPDAELEAIIRTFGQSPTTVRTNESQNPSLKAMFESLGNKLRRFRLR